ncbi:3-beta hydroxysteroid dehydrogenase [Cupriavidus sp. HPC(L)]|uniref:NAD(P)-dependent oxidoreductase n=1 Tax=Cupriavidus sp. HPC(L) TaxID=1217418 RepID=UPI0002910374|nr:NAD(P)-dependent oxidoreductase [Cupriavidus sp. HPC(L)]ESJ22359.1 3-beta hydroxysteroid dehydrogenase [Cupriavidus sp. HPC(L)]
MQIAILGATGRVGSRIADEALRRGHTVTAIARHAGTLADRPGLKRLDADIADRANTAKLAPALAGHDALVSAVRFAQAGPEPLLRLARQAGVKRVAVVGGAGSLYVARGVQLVDTPEFPAAYKDEALAGRGFLNALRGENELDWVFLSPSALLEPGQRTGSYRVGKDELLADANGKSWISMEDFAVALVDELERHAHSRERFTVGY